MFSSNILQKFMKEFIFRTTDLQFNRNPKNGQKLVTLRYVVASNSELIAECEALGVEEYAPKEQVI